MAVYVDQLLKYGTKKWSHMEADSLNELHEFAKSIGVAKCWFHNPRNQGSPHYDLNPEQRARAVAAGAIEKDFRWMIEWRRERNRQAGLKNVYFI